ncbi:MAG: helix-turn-helix domain-containing protein [Steroidobacteraceae bacterium]|jgi:Fis family transcriptional regulator|nr:Fis family transcriptional regulator [Gammaproteobacteria bacterium]
MATPDTLPDSLPLRGHAERAFEDYLQQLNGHPSGGLYELALREIEEPLFRVVLRHVDGNQSRAADILGIHRATLRRKLRDLGLS